MMLQRKISGWPLWQIIALVIVMILVGMGIVSVIQVREFKDEITIAQVTPTIAPLDTDRPIDKAQSDATPTPTSPPTSTPIPIPTQTPTPTNTPTPTHTPTPTATPTQTPTSTPTPTPTPIAVITGIHAFGRLETTQYVMQTLIEIEDEPDTLLERLSRDKLLLIAEGEVVAGFDLTQVLAGDIVVVGRAVTLTLSPPEILYSRVDNERTFVYERDTGLLRNPDPELETKARRKAEEKLTNWALERGILEDAKEYGRSYLENFLRSLGFTQVTVTIKEAE